ncbi:MAG TPA: glycosyltransferase 87 family protein, partial [Ktedonobacterales bacterium]|nr:glycosyltransferase 87 family protein [Ktedonobacterales bacterium]
MIGPNTSAKAPRASALALTALAIGATVLGFIGGLIRPSNEFETMYAAARAVADNRMANVYDYATLAQLNASHHYVDGALYPFTYPPFTLLALRPLALLPFDAARVAWTAIVYAALLGTALLLADAFARLLR